MVTDKECDSEVVVENGNVRLINSADYAMQMLQAQMTGETEVTGLTSDNTVMDLVKEIRKESEENEGFN